MDLMAVNSSEAFGIDSRIESFFPYKGSSVVEQKGVTDSQCVLFVLLSLAGFKGNLDCCNSRSNRNGDVRGYNRRWPWLWLRWDVDLFPVEFVVVTVVLWGVAMKVVHRMP